MGTLFFLLFPGSRLLGVRSLSFPIPRQSIEILPTKNNHDLELRIGSMSQHTKTTHARKKQMTPDEEVWRSTNSAAAAATAHSRGWCM